MGGFTEVILYKGTIIGRDRFENLTRDTEKYRENLIEITDDDSAWIFTNNYIKEDLIIIQDEFDFMQNPLETANQHIMTVDNETVEMNVESIEAYFVNKWTTPLIEDEDEIFQNDMYIATIYWREDFRGKYEPKVKTKKIPHQMCIMPRKIK